MPGGQEIKLEIKKRAMFLLGCVGLLWGIWLIDLITPFINLRVLGIRPRQLGGLLGIPCAPFLHNKWTHLLGNTIPFLILGGLVLMRGYSHFLKVAALCALFSGLGTWVFGGGNTVHIGVSGVIFGFLGYLIARGFYEKKFASFLLSVVVGLFYVGTILSLANPERGISWSAHFWGFAGGILTARILHGHTPEKPEKALPL